MSLKNDAQAVAWIMITIGGFMIGAAVAILKTLR